MTASLQVQAEEAVSRLRIARSDLQTVEARAASTGLPPAVKESVSAFANTRGGLLLLGLDQPGFRPIDVDAPQLARDLASACAEDLDPPIVPDIDIVTIGGRRVVAALVDELPVGRKPCFLKRQGIDRGAYVRTHGGDRRLTSYEVHILVSGRGQPRDDVAVVEGASRDHLAPGLVEALLRRVRSRKGPLLADAGDDEVLRMMNVLADGDPPGVSLAGLLALGRYPQQFVPQVNITFVAYPTAQGEPLADGTRFLDNESIDGPIPTMLATAQAAVLRNITRRAVVSGAGRLDDWEYPEEVVRELVVNSLMHRDYHPLAHGSQVRIELYPDRLEVVSPGGLHGPVDRRKLMTEPVTSSRNSHIAKLLEDIEVPRTGRTVSENRGSGLIAVAASLRRAGMAPLHISDRIDSFRVVVRNRRLTAEEMDLSWGFRRSRRGSTGPPRRRDRRHEIRELLARGPRPSRELAQELGMTPQGILRWLRMMEATGEVRPTESARRSPMNRWQLIER